MINTFPVTEKVMEAIHEDCGAGRSFSRKWFAILNAAIEEFVDLNPCINLSDLIEIATGEQALYAHCNGYQELSETLNNYFEQLN